MINFYSLYLKDSESRKIFNTYFPAETTLPLMAVITSEKAQNDYHVEYLTSTYPLNRVMDHLAPFFSSGDLKYINENNFIETVQNSVQNFSALL